MRRIGTIPAILLAFVIGCATASVVKLDVPPARADGGQGRLEYYCVNMDEGVTEYSNQMGAQGWRLVTAAAYTGTVSGTSTGKKMIWCYERPLPSNTPNTPSAAPPNPQ